MKNLALVALLLAASAPAFAAQRDIVSLDCQSRPRSFADITLKVGSMWGAEDLSSATLRDVVMTVKEDGKASTGRLHTLESDADYKPRKYKNTLRFDMSQLVDTKDFSRFWPIDQCTIKVMIPNDVIPSNVSRFEAPVVINCDQSGGSQTLDCSVTTKR